MNPEKKAARNQRNKELKQQKAETRKAFMALLGRTVVEKEVNLGEGEDGKPVVKKYSDFPVYIKTAADGSPLAYRGRQSNPPHLAFVGMKAHTNSGPQRKTRPGETRFHVEAVTEDASRTFAKEVDKILNPAPVETVPVVPIDAAETVASL